MFSPFLPLSLSLTSHTDSLHLYHFSFVLLYFHLCPSSFLSSSPLSFFLISLLPHFCLHTYFLPLFPPVESRSEFLEKLQRARSQVKPVTASQPILSSVGPTKLTVGNWSLTCLKDGEIAIHNSDGQQATILKEDLPGFVFESNRGTKHSFTAETSLGEFDHFIKYTF